MDWEGWLRTAVKPPSDNEDSKRATTEAQIRKALAAYECLKGKPYRVYVKGSYANNTNVRLNYDVDIAVEYYGYFYHDLCFELENEDKSVVGVVDSSDPYTRSDFKTDVLAALQEAFGTSAVEVGKIVYRVRQKKTTLPADVVPCWEYRRYDAIVNGVPTVHIGSRVFPSSGGHKDNFPKRQLDSGTTKNNATGRRYKRMVRAFKKLQTKMVSEGLLDKELPSYFSECLVYNVGNDAFGHATYLGDMRSVLAQIFNATLPTGAYAKWTQVHGLQYLFHGSFQRADAHKVASAAWDHMDLE